MRVLEQRSDIVCLPAYSAPESTPFSTQRTFLNVFVVFVRVFYTINMVNYILCMYIAEQIRIVLRNNGKGLSNA